MEIVRIKTVNDSGKKSGENSIINVELEDGRKGTAFTSDALKWSGELSLEVKPAKPFNNENRFYFFPAKSTLKGIKKDYTFEKRSASLNYAIQSANLVVKDKITTEQILLVADKFYDYLNKSN